MSIGKNQPESPSSILIVDDFEANLQLLGNILQEQNFDIFFASSGKDAISILETELPDLILLDIMMPEMDGFETCKIIKNDPRTKDIPLIFLTAKAEIEDIVKGFELGAVDYVSKPFNSSELLARINTHLTLKKAKEQLIELNLTKSKFFSIITNDIKDITIGVKSFSDFIIQDIETNDTENIIKSAKILHSDASKLYEFLQTISEWAIIQTDQVENKPEVLFAKQIFDDIIASYEKSIEHKNIKINNNIDNDLYLKVDKKMFKTIINKLLSNAIKYSNIGGEVDVNAKQIENKFEFSIKDNGIGIDSHVISKLFRIDTPYQKTVGTLNEKGTGLGLIISKSLIDKLGGEISIESRKHIETMVKFVLPKII